MKLISAEYDAYNRQFKLLHSADAGELRDGATYLFMDFSDEELKQPEDIADLDVIFQELSTT